jgi:glycerol-3-phosphate acyltransferase PlsY
LIVFYSSRYVALASIFAAMAIPVAMAVIMTWQHRWNFVLLGLGLVMGTLVVVRHHSNIARLLSGTENQFSKKK